MNARVPSDRTIADGHTPTGRAGDLDSVTHDWVRRHGVADVCDFTVERDGRWWVFDGKVDSQMTKCSLIDLTPTVDGAQWVVDKLRVHRRARGEGDAATRHG